MTQSSFICIGHRGASGHAPENTLKAFNLAIEMGCPWIELDVYVVEGELIVIHDDDVDRTTNGTGSVMESSLDYLRSLDAGENEQIPTLREVITLVDHRAGINIELKGPNTAQPVCALLNEFCARGWDASEFLLSSFSHRELALGDRIYPRGALFFKEVDDYFERTQKLGAHSLNLSSKLITQSVIKEAHDKGLKVFVYTVNQKIDMENLKKMGVDGVFTNYPDRFPAIENPNG
ncbi:MAG: hypothetical protein JKY88_06335 [Pseudomonadales bacterium]|nr:hypothetical protein [Pseudomonadales bacterium]